MRSGESTQVITFVTTESVGDQIYENVMCREARKAMKQFTDGTHHAQSLKQGNLIGRSAEIGRKTALDEAVF